MFFQCQKMIAAALFALFASLPACAVKNRLDLKGDGNIKAVELPFTYYQRKSGDRLSLIYQGGYKVYDIQQSQKDVAILGGLRPCIGIAVTDGAKMAVFHKHSTNAPSSMKTILETNLDTTRKSNWVARIFTTKDQEEWVNNKRASMHGGKSHPEEVRHLKDVLEAMGMNRNQIGASLYDLKLKNPSRQRYEDGFLGRYEFAELHVGVRMDEVFQQTNDTKHIQFCSIDPYEEDVFGYKGTSISQMEMLQAPTSQQRRAIPAADLHIPYNDIPKIVLQQTGQTNGYAYQRGIGERRAAQESKELYFKHFGKSKQQALDTQYRLENMGYETLEFYPI